jgi:PBP1b-binding outer membrane lipoprotein LpoB
MNRILQILILALLVTSCKSTNHKISDQFKNNYQLFVQLNPIYALENEKGGLMFSTF